MSAPLLRSGQHAFDDVGFFDAGEFHVQAAELKGEALVIDAHAMEDGRVEVAEVYAVLGDIVGEVIGHPVFEARLDAAAGQEHREATAMVVASAGWIAEAALGESGASELGGEDDQGVLE